LQIIYGTAEVKIDDKSILLKLGKGIIIPAHSKPSFTGNEHVIMITKIIKIGSGV
jgi:quercetin dioxygenase-like cupin family protein